MTAAPAAAGTDRRPDGDGSVLGEDGVRRCPWASAPGRMREYHDTEWGVPVHGEQAFFERLSLEAFQAGLSWATILGKRPRFREVFHGFDVDRVAAMTDDDLEVLLLDTGIVRNRAKVLATRTNARATVALRGGEGLEAFVRGFAPAEDPAPADARRGPHGVARVAPCPRRCAARASRSWGRPRCTP